MQDAYETHDDCPTEDALVVGESTWWRSRVLERGPYLYFSVG
jgi:hypothetical protein